ncbi:hypothetical protein [Neorhizobium sp. AL 9.2.2]|uniref:hypothetical protein n=1 Tax=Neorhizobium sp. AL 9.2.2 TaxID=2712894 RepID=UPI0015719B8C|nr:hypothetical protein [Neorhizobium sp. AL 9.2.2]NSY16155.1 hypothetical protein [Neorhizobium sp. AL 9.2.2]
MQPQDYAKIETNLFPKIRKRFESEGMIDPIDLYAILAWKANRASGKHVKRLDGVKCFRLLSVELGKALSEARDNESRLSVVMSKPFMFRLPTATSILMVLFPEEFTVYDVRVCDSIGGFHELTGRRFTERLFPDYQRFKAEVIAKAPFGLSLREADQYHWGRNWLEGARKVVGADDDCISSCSAI